MTWKITNLTRSAVVVITWLAACSVPPTATIPPSPVVLNVAYSPYLARIQDALQVCAAKLPQTAIFFELIPGAEQLFTDYDLVIWWGDQPPDMDFAYPLNEDQLVVILNPDNPKQALSQAELISLFSGRIERWTEIGTLDQQVKVWIFPENNLLSESFRVEVLGQWQFSRLASIAPSPQAMLEEVGATPGAIGFLPGSWLSSDVVPVEIDPELQLAVQKPLLALTHEEPHADLKDLVACLQTGAGQDVLAENYQITR